tara:strand:+ start:1619 stop:2890 length:1272 start_codon:yes stop_codon:yes gene_type:complete
MLSIYYYLIMYLYILLLFIGLLILSAFFSGSETAFLNLKNQNKKVPNEILQFANKPKRLLIGLLSGNTIINISIAFLGAYVIHKFASEFSISPSILKLIDIVFLSLILLIFGEVVPKVFAMRNSVKVARSAYIPLKFIFMVFKPFIFLFHKITLFFNSIISVQDEKIFDSEEELKILAELSEEEGTLEEEESDMIQSIIEFNDKEAGEILIPRVDIVGIESSENLDAAMDLISKEQFSKIPLYVDNMDNITGILHAKDLVPYLTGSRPNISLSSIARAPFFVPENKPIDELLNDFKNKKTSIAIIVDEWGGTEGLITLEDIVEEVLGEIRDPFDNETNLINKISTGAYMVDAKISIYDLQEAIDISFPDIRDYDTLGGFILNQLQEIPKKNDQVIFNTNIFIVMTINKNRIGQIKIVRNETKS